jgi:hypothetical protein
LITTNLRSCIAETTSSRVGCTHNFGQDDCSAPRNLDVQELVL